MTSKYLLFPAIICVFLTGVGNPAKTIESTGEAVIKPAPTAPKISDDERHAELSARREKVFAGMKDKSLMILFSTEPRVYTNDVDYAYRQENNLYYLTALKQKDATLVLLKNGESRQEFLFLPKRDPQFETWNGKMYSNEEAAQISGIKNILDDKEWEPFFSSVKAKKDYQSADKSFLFSPAATENLYLLIPQIDSQTSDIREYRREWETAHEFAKVSIDEKTHQVNYEQKLGYNLLNALPIFTELRSVKSPYEIKLLQHAIDITTEAQESAMAIVGRANWEYEVQAEVEYTFRRRNADYWGYPSIVGCGPNATTLHYEDPQSEIKKGSLLLMDVGAEYEHYTADVTRTFPVNGKFSKEQADIYRIIYDAQEAAAQQMKPGNKFSEPNKAARRVVEEGLVKLGLTTAVGAFIPGTEKEVPDGQGGKRIIGMTQSSLWFMHGLGHWLGMNVHDIGGGYATIFKPGMVMTNEPGIYVREDALNYFDMSKPEVKAFVEAIRPGFEKYKNIGVRIEDDMLITESGAQWLTKALPRKLEDVEAFMAKASKEIKTAKSEKSISSNPYVFAAKSNLPLIDFISPNFKAS